MASQNTSDQEDDNMPLARGRSNNGTDSRNDDTNRRQPGESERENHTNRHAQTDANAKTDRRILTGTHRSAREHTRSDRVRHADRQTNSHWIIHTH